MKEFTCQRCQGERSKVQALLSNRYCRVCYPYVKAEKAKRAEQQGKRR